MFRHSFVLVYHIISETLIIQFVIKHFPSFMDKYFTFNDLELVSFCSLTVSEEGPARLAAVERRKGLPLLAHKSVPPHLFGAAELPDFLQTAFQVVDGVIGPVVHQTSQQTLWGAERMRCS